MSATSRLISAVPRPFQRRVESTVQKFVPSLPEAYKIRLIDYAYKTYGYKSQADLGGVWRVEGGYTMHALERWSPERAVMVDLEFTDQVNAKQAVFPQLELINRRFGDPDVAAEVGQVDIVILFDILVHQVAPDWDEILALWAPNTKCFLIGNPQWTGPETVRLPHLPRDEFLANVPADDEQHSLHHIVLEDGAQPDVFGKALEDSTAIWQWGITDADLRAKMSALGFTETHDVNIGQWGKLPRFARRGFVFVKQ